jgi:hypothetical protein
MIQMIQRCSRVSLVNVRSDADVADVAVKIPTVVLENLEASRHRNISTALLRLAGVDAFRQLPSPPMHPTKAECTLEGHDPKFRISYRILHDTRNIAR